MKLKKICDCGHRENTCSIKKVKNKTFCHSCWKAHQEREGLVDEGCIFPGAEVCADREPSISSFDKMRKVKCYRGHKNCIKQDAEKVLSLIEKDAGNKPVTCTFPGCGRKLERITTIIPPL